MQIQEEISYGGLEHEGQSAEQAYADRLHQLSLIEGGARDGQTVVKALVVRCTLWIEIVREK